MQRQIKRVGGDAGQLGVSLLSAALTLIPYTTPLGISIGIFDAAGGFEGFYNHLDNQEQLYDNTGLIIIPTSYSPIIINTNNN